MIKVPILAAAHEINPQGANVIAVSFLVAYTGLVRRESALESLKEQFPRFIEKNMKCAKRALSSQTSCLTSKKLIIPPAAFQQVGYVYTNELK